jgi:hypothetical protein
VRRTTQRRRATALVTVLATAAGLLAFVLTAPPASAGTNPNTTYDVECRPQLGSPSSPANPFIVTANLNATPSPSYPTGATFGAAGALSFTAQGPVLAAFAANGILNPDGTTGLTVTNLKLGTTDGSATGVYDYDKTFAAATPPHHTVSNVTWSSGSTTLNGTGFTAADLGSGLVGPGIQNGAAIVAVTATTATISMSTTAAQASGDVELYSAMTFTDAAVSTGNVFTTNGTAGGQGNIGLQTVDSFTFNNGFPGGVIMGGTAGYGANRCLTTGWSGATPGPGQTPLPVPVLPSGVTTPLVAASGGFLAQPGTAQQITLPAAAFVSLADPPPVAQSATFALGTGQTRVVTLSATDADPTPTTSCALVPASISDARLTVTNLNSPNVCSATLTDNGTGVGTVTFQFTASDAVGAGPAATVTVNIGTPTVDERLSQEVIGGALVLSCTNPDTSLTPDLACDDFAFGDVTLNGLQQTRTGAGSTLYVSDNRGNPAVGWSLTAYMVATPDNPNAACGPVVAFCNADVGTNALNPNGQIAKTNLSIDSIGCDPHLGNLNAATAGAGGDFGSTQTLCTAPVGASGGTFDVTKEFTLTIPSSVYAGTYWATVQYLVQ